MENYSEYSEPKSHQALTAAVPDKGHEFWPMTLCRPMRLYGKAVGLVPHVSGKPDPDFLFKVLTRFPTHKAMVRGELTDSNFKNLENFLRQTHSVSRTTVEVVADALNVDVELLEEAKHGKSDGPLWPHLQETLWMVETFSSTAFKGLTSVPVLCPNCNANVIDDVDVWWHDAMGSIRIEISRPEFLFAERLMRALIGWNTFMGLLDGKNTQGIGNWLELAHPKKHPIGNWLRVLMNARSVKGLQGIIDDLPLEGGESDIAPRLPRLKEWSSGMTLIPFHTGELLMAGLADEQELLLHFRLARAIVFVQDFLAAAALNLPNHDEVVVRELVSNRLQTLSLNIGMSLASASKVRVA